MINSLPHIPYGKEEKYVETNKVVETEKKDKPVDKRVVRLVTKPYLFPGIDQPYSEEIIIRAISDKTYEKSYRGIKPGPTNIRRVKTVTLNNRSNAEGTLIKTVSEYIDYLLSSRGYSLVQ